ncbi:MAG TPA: hypothetical protein VMR79_02380, partial [Verrucomicrobiae bacterium]|nr:hypothetical protein [Verrucomicrobiae bacterium]
MLLTGAGSGFSRWDGLALTAWSADRTEDAEGFVLYLRDLERDVLWSLGHQPVQRPAARYRVRYRPGVMTITRLDEGIEAVLDVAVVADGDLELRRLQLRNRSRRRRRLEVTSYAEIVLNDPAAHAAHPAFSKLFVQTEYVADAGVLLAHRRPRSPTERVAWMVHALAGEGRLGHETDRARFVGRGRTPARPLALSVRAPLSGTSGSVLDPAMSLRRTIVLRPGEAAVVTAVLGAAPTREAAVALAGRWASPAEVAGALARAGEWERALLARLGLGEDDAERFQELAGAILYGLPADKRIADRARDYWRAKGLDLVPRKGASPSRPRRAAAARFRPAAPERSRGDAPALRFENGYGGFTPDGTEYVVRLGPRPPLP